MDYWGQIGGTGRSGFPNWVGLSRGAARLGSSHLFYSQLLSSSRQPLVSRPKCCANSAYLVIKVGDNVPPVKGLL